MLFDIIDSIRSAPLVVSTKPQLHLYPSSASIEYNHPVLGKTVVGSCLRKEFYNITGEAKPVGREATSMRIMEVGNLLSEMFVEEFKKAGIYIADEVPFYDPVLNVSGRIDAIIRDPYKEMIPTQRPLPEDMIGIEFKSTGGYHNIKGPIISTKDTPLKPKDEHVLQSIIYLNYYKKWGVKKWILFYIDRESLKYQTHTLSFNDAGTVDVTNPQNSFTLNHISMAGIDARFRALNEYLKTKTTPPRDYTLQYSNSKLLLLHKNNLLNKTNTEAMDKLLKKKVGTKDTDKPLIAHGDKECSWCDFKEICWGSKETKAKEPVTMTEPDEFIA